MPPGNWLRQPNVPTDETCEHISLNPTKCNPNDSMNGMIGALTKNRHTPALQNVTAHSINIGTLETSWKLQTCVCACECLVCSLCCVFFFAKQVLSIFSHWINLKTYYFVQFYLTWMPVGHTRKHKNTSHKRSIAHAVLFHTEMGQTATNINSMDLLCKRHIFDT